MEGKCGADKLPVLWRSEKGTICVRRVTSKPVPPGANRFGLKTGSTGSETEGQEGMLEYTDCPLAMILGSTLPEITHRHLSRRLAWNMA